MMLRIVSLLMFVLASGVVSAGQQPPPEPAGRPGARPTTPPSVAPAPAPREALPIRKTRGRDLNLQVELTITDQGGGAVPDKKVVSMLAADGTLGRIRSNAGNGAVVLNIDALPQVLDNDRILLELTLEYTPGLPAEGPMPQRRPASLHESLRVLLQNGKSLMISQAADPQTDRKMTVEVRATIVK